MIDNDNELFKIVLFCYFKDFYVVYWFIYKDKKGILKDLKLFDFINKG